MNDQNGVKSSFVNLQRQSLLNTSLWESGFFLYYAMFDKHLKTPNWKEIRDFDCRNIEPALSNWTP